MGIETAGHGSAVGLGGLVLDLGTALVRLIAPEIAGDLHCWTGAYITMFATGNGRACRHPADFDWFRYTSSPGEAKS